jgi:hypothetical protein
VFSGIFLNFPPDLSAQVDEKSSSPGAKSAEAKNSDHSIFAGLGYGSNMIYLGSTISRDQPYGYAALTYGYKNKLFASISSVHLNDRNPFVAFNIGSLSYYNAFNSWFDISASASYYNVAPSLADTLFGSFFYAEMTPGFDWKILYTKISFGGLFSEDKNAFLQLRNSRFFQTPEFTSKDLFFSFDPYVNLLFGSLTTVETTYGTTISLTAPYGKAGRRYQVSSTELYSTKFSFMEIDFGVPVAFNSDRLTFEAEPGYVLPLYDNQYYPSTRGFILMLSLYFRIF